MPFANSFFTLTSAIIRAICGYNRNCPLSFAKSEFQKGLSGFEFAKSGFQKPLSRSDIANSNPDITKSGLEKPLSGFDIAKSELEIANSNPDIAKSRSDIAMSNLEITKSDSDIAKSKPDFAMSKLQKRLSKVRFAMSLSYFWNEMPHLFTSQAASIKIDGTVENSLQNPILEKSAARRRFPP